MKKATAVMTVVSFVGEGLVLFSRIVVHDIEKLHLIVCQHQFRFRKRRPAYSDDAVFLFQILQDDFFR